LHKRERKTIRTTVSRQLLLPSGNCHCQAVTIAKRRDDFSPPTFSSAPKEKNRKPIRLNLCRPDKSDRASQIKAGLSGSFLYSLNLQQAESFRQLERDTQTLRATLRGDLRLIMLLAFGCVKQFLR
jgi:hypothetical protein